MPAPIPLRHWRGEVIKRWNNDVIEKRCSGCKQWKPYDDEHFQFISTKGYYHCRCRVCAREEVKKYAKRAALQPVNT